MTKPEHAKDDFCPDCFRNKAHSAEEVMWGYCEKWWATRDAEARVMCDKIAGRIALAQPATEPAPQPGYGKALSRGMRGWLSSPAGDKACDPVTLKAPADQRVYLNNRLQTAYIAGADFGSMFSNQPAAPVAYPRGPIEQERIVAAAYLYGDGEVRIGVRHGDPFMRRGKDSPQCQGFVTNMLARFVDRTEALQIALAAGQVQRRHLPGDELDSSDVW